MTDNLLKTALREAASREFAGIPQSDGDITYTFSPRFTRRMNRLAKAEKSWLWRMTSTASKRAAAAGIAMILIALTACSIPAIREPVAAFFKGTYENCVRFFTGNAGADRIAERYTLTELPDGFEAVYTVDNDASFTVVYRNEDGEEIILSQSVGADYWIDIDTQHGTLTEIDLSGVTVTLYEADGCMVALWQQDGYAFDLTIYVNEIGELVKPGYLTQRFPYILEKNGLRKIRYHDLRHSCASLLYANGVSLKEIQEWLGHSDIATTSNIYTHLNFSSKVASANAIMGVYPSL